MRHLLTALAIVAFAAPVAAQPTPWSPERNTAGWVFTPAIVFGGLWDTNPTLRNDATPHTTELVGLVNPRGEIDFSGKRTKFSAGYSGSLEAYRDVAELTRYDQRGRLMARHQMTPRLQFNTQQQLTLTPTTDQLDLSGLRFTRVGSLMFDSRGGFVYDLTPRSLVEATYNFQWVDFDRAAESSPDFVFLQGGHMHYTESQYRYQVTRRFDVGGSWSLRRTSIDGGQDIFNTHEMRGVVRFGVGPTTAIHGSAGFAHASGQRSNETQVGPSFAAGMSHTTPRVMFHAGYERSFLPSFGFGGLSANQVLQSGVTVPLARGRMFAGSTFSWRRTEPAVERGLNITLNSYWWNSSFGFHVARWLRTETFVAWAHQISDAQGNVDRTRIGVQFVTLKPMRIQ